MSLRSLTLLFFASVAVAACTKNSDSNLSADHVWIRFRNPNIEPVTGAFILYSTDTIGNIAPKSVSEYIMLDSFQVAYDMPFETVQGLIGRDTFYASAGGFCGTGLVLTTLEPGKYTLVLKPYETSAGNGSTVRYMQLQFQD